jgi:hypothetical protein
MLNKKKHWKLVDCSAVLGKKLVLQVSNRIPRFLKIAGYLSVAELHEELFTF